MLSGRAKRVLVYTATLLGAPVLVLPFVPGTPAYAAAGAVCGVLLSAGSAYAARGELQTRPRLLVGTKLLICALFTLLLGVSMVAVALVWRLRT